MRWFFEFDTMTWPPFAKACSISVATEASMAENISFGAPLPGFESCTIRSATLAGVVPSRCHFAASRYFLPAERSLAPSHVKSNQGWPCKNLMKCWPTIPVAPKMPTSILVSIVPVPCVDKFRRRRATAAWARALRACAPRESCPVRTERAGPNWFRRPGYRWCRRPPLFPCRRASRGAAREFRAPSLSATRPRTASAMPFLVEEESPTRRMRISARA